MQKVKKSLNLTVGTEFFPEWLLIKLGLVVDEEEETPEEQEEEVVPEEPEIPEVVKPDEEKKTQVLQFLDGEGKPLSNASLEIEGKKYVTDSNGEVKVSGLEEGKKYKVNIKHNGKVYESEVLGASEVDESVKIEVTQDQRVVDWKKILLYSAIGIGLLFLIVLIFRKKHS